MKINRKGMTLVELIISIALLSVVLGFLFKILLDVKYESEHAGYATNNQINRAEIIRTVQEDILEYGMHPSTNSEVFAYENHASIDYGETETEIDGKRVVYRKTGSLYITDENVLEYALETATKIYESSSSTREYYDTDEVKKWEIKDKNYKFGNFELEESDDRCYFIITLPVINGVNNNIIDDIEIVGKRGWC